jgi:hypothetical protein
MSDSQSEPVGEVETALLDAELFVKYHAPERAIKRLRTALERSPRSIQLRERLRDRREPQSRTTFSPSLQLMKPLDVADKVAGAKAEVLLYFAKLLRRSSSSRCIL